MSSAKWWNRRKWYLCVNMIKKKKKPLMSLRLGIYMYYVLNGFYCKVFSFSLKLIILIEVLINQLTRDLHVSSALRNISYWGDRGSESWLDVIPSVSMPHERVKAASLSSSPLRLAQSSTSALEEAVSPLGYRNMLFLIRTLHKTVAMIWSLFSLLYHSWNGTDHKVIEYLMPN